MTYLQAMEEFFQYLLDSGRSSYTVQTYRKQLNRYYRYLCWQKNSEIYIEDINSDDFEKYLLEGCKGYESSSKYTLITSFKSFMIYCFNMGHCKINIAKQIKQVRSRVKEKVSLTEDEFQSIVDNIDNLTIKCAVYTMFYTGCRIGELEKLKMDDVDFNKNCIYIRKPEGIYQKDRTIPINHKLRNLLDEYLLIRPGGETEANFFVLKRSGRMSQSTVNRALREAATKSGINKQITNHTMRHTFSSLLAEKGIDLKRIQSLLGHHNINTTNIYLHASYKSLKGAIDLL